MADTVDSLAKTIDDLGGRAMLVDDEPVELASLTQALAKLAKGAESAGCDELAQAAFNLSCGASSGDDLRHGLSQMQKILEAEAAKVSDNLAKRVPPAPLGLDPALLNDFIIEARDHLTTIETKVLALELDPNEIEAVHAIFRGFHTIKGLAGFLDLPSIQAVAHEVETLLDQVRTGQLVVTPEMVDVILAGADYLKTDVVRIESTLAGTVCGGPAPNEALIARVHSLTKGSVEIGSLTLKALTSTLSHDASAATKREEQTAPEEPIQVPGVITSKASE